MPHALAFFGTSSFAVPLLRALSRDARFSVVLAVTQPDRPVGRAQTLTPPPVKAAALEIGIPVFQPERMRTEEALESLKTVRFDAAVVASYGQILPQAVLDLAPDRFVNLHGSLLPSYRGASPIAEAIKNGDAETGVTAMVMDAGMDHGPAIAEARLPIAPDATTETLSDGLADLGAAWFPDILADYLAGTRAAIPQDHGRATFCKLVKKEDGFVDAATDPALKIGRLVRAYTPWPLVQTKLGGKTVKLLETVPGPPTDRAPGTLWEEASGLRLACADGTSLELVSVRPEGGKTMAGNAFFRGMR